MTKDLSKYISEVLSGVSMGQAAKAAGVHLNTLRKHVVNHPDYKKAKANGTIHPKGLPGLTPNPSVTANAATAVDEVLAGATIAATAAKYGIPPSSLSLLVRRKGVLATTKAKGKDPEVAAKAQLKIARRAIAKAEELMRSIPGNEGWVANIGVQLAAAEAMAKPKRRPASDRDFKFASKPVRPIEKRKITEAEINDLVRDSLA
ncbi:MAG: hypothetical protein K9K38_17225 [Rhodoferax sp.]|nr:hypothetical protein [Rhodoferax sp.]MCF8211121.1 hypothetical protein [Rhodoferax sp.]